MFLCTLILRISGNTKIYAFNCLLLIDSSNCNCASYDDRSFCGLGDRPGIRQTSGSGQQDHVVYPCAAPFASSQWQTHTWIRLFSSQLDPFVVTIRSIFSIRPDNMECKQFQGKLIWDLPLKMHIIQTLEAGIRSIHQTIFQCFHLTTIISLFPLCCPQ